MLKVYKVKLSSFVRKLGGLAGMEMKMSDEERFLKLLQYHKIDLIIDIGANKGQFAALCFALGYKGRIVSLEPLKEVYDILKKNAAAHPLWEVPERMAIGNTDGNIEMNISENSVSSSILDIREEHTSSMASSKYIGKETVPIRNLDTIFSEIKKEAKNILLKVDTQGYEEAVLAGAEQSLQHIKGVQLEMSLVRLYEGQPDFISMYQKMQNLGFHLELIEPGFTDKNTGRVLQTDGLFFRNN